MYIETEDDVKAIALEIAQSFPDLNYSGAPIDPDGELVLRLQAIISRHIPDAGEVERLRGIVRGQRETIKHWQHHVLITSRLLGCSAIDKDVEAAIDKLKHDHEDARANAINEAVARLVKEADAVETTANYLGDRDKAGLLYADVKGIRKAIAALQSLLDKKEGEDGRT